MNKLTTFDFGTFCIRAKASFKWGQRSKFWSQSSDIYIHCLCMLAVKTVEKPRGALVEKYLNIQDCLEKSLKIKFALKSTWKTQRSWKVLEFYHLQKDSTLFSEN